MMGLLRRTLATGLSAAALFVSVSASTDHQPPAAARPTAPPDAEITVDVSQQWTDSGIDVHVGDQLTIWATGEIHGASHGGQAIGPDGVSGNSFEVGQGGLVGQIGDNPWFNVGARSHMVRHQTRYTHHWVQPAPLHVTHDGRLKLGVHDWRAGRYQGTFTVSIWRAVPGARDQGPHERPGPKD